MPFVGSLNRVVIIGNIANDPVLAYTQQTNTPVCRFTVATNRKFKTQSGETKESASFHRIVIWGNRAENLSKILTKGTKVYVEGRLVYNPRELSDGKTCKEASIRALDIIILSRKRSPMGANNTQNMSSSDSASDEDTDAVLDLESIAQDLGNNEASEDSDKKEAKDAHNANDANNEEEDNPEEDLPF